MPNAREICAWVLWIAVALGLTLGGSNFFVWLLGAVPALFLEHGLMVMRMNTAIAITTAALSLACWSGSPGRVRTQCARCLAMLPLLIGTLTSLQDLAAIDLHIDTLFAPGTIPGDLASAHVHHAGRMSLNAALSLMFLGLALASVDTSISLGRRRLCFAPGLALAAALPSTLGLVGYLLGVPRFTGILRSTNILLHAAAALLALALGILAARPSLPPMRRILSTAADGVLLRWMLPGSVALFLMLGWLIGRGRALGLVMSGEGTALMLYGGMTLLFGLLIAASRAVARQENRAHVAGHALREGEERSRAILDTSLDAVLLMDSAGLIVDWNPAAERIFGWSRAEVVGQSLGERIIPEELRAAHQRGLDHLTKTGEGPILGQRLELTALRRDGARFPIELSVNPLPRAERTLFVGFVRDITERQAADEKLRAAKDAAEAASRAKDHFVAALSHELRTPLAPVLLSAASLRSDPRLPADVREQMAMMERSIGLEARLIDDLLDLTRISRGKLSLRTESLEVHSLLSYAVDIVRDDARGKNIAVALEFAAVRCGMRGDPARLQQVFWNLLKNAVKFTPAGGRILVKTRDEENGGTRLIIEVSDSGLGFDPEVAEQIFQPFEQAGREGDHRLGGLGLGLAIARAIVDLHGGKIRAHSAGVGLGATFTVELPGATLPPAGVHPPTPPEAGEPMPSAPRRILLVEDHEATLQVLSRLLHRAGHDVITASSVTAALAAVDGRTFDVLISDLGLPDGTGVDLITALRARRSDFRAIALSGYGMEDDMQRTRAAGFDEHLVKPVDFEQLRRALSKLAPES